MEKDVIETVVIPEVPKVLPNEQLYVYVPMASFNDPGIASYNEAHFEINAGQVSISVSLMHKILNAVQRSGDTITGGLIIGYVGEGEHEDDTRAVKVPGDSYGVDVIDGKNRTEYNNGYIRDVYNGKTISLLFPSSGGILARLEDVNKSKTELSETIDDVKQELSEDINNVKQELSEDIAELDYANTIDLFVDPQTYVMTVTLKNPNGETVSESTVDLPLESVVVSGEFDEETSEIVLILENGNKIRFPVSNIVGGFISDKEFEDFLATKGQAHGFAGLDANGKVPKEQLPAGSSGGTSSGGISAEEFEELLVESLTNPAEEWTDEEKAAACGTIGAVGKKDRAMEGKLGLVSSSDLFCFLVNTSGTPMAKILSLDVYKKATNSAFISKGTLENIKNTYVKEGITTNTDEWTDEERVAACETIGALPLSGGQMTGEIKLAQGDNNGINLGSQGVINSGTNTVLGFIYGRYCIGSYNIPTVIRTSEEKLKVQLGISGSGNGGYQNLATEKYVDDGFVAKSYADANFVKVPAYGTKTGAIIRYSDGSTTGVNVAPAGQISVSDIVRYSSTGTLAANNPVNATDVVNKQYGEANYVPVPALSGPGRYRVTGMGKNSAGDLLTSSIDIANYGATPTNAAIIRANASGNITVADPVNASDAATKQYVDTMSIKPATPAAASVVTIGTDDAIGSVQYSQSNVTNAIVQRKANGCIACATGTQSNEATTKGYVDTAITNNARIPSTINVSLIGQDYDTGKVGIKLSLTNDDYSQITDFLSLCSYLYNHDIYSISNAVPAYGTITLTGGTEIKFIGCAYGVQSFLTLVNADGQTYTLGSTDVSEELDKYQQT